MPASTECTQLYVGSWVLGQPSGNVKLVLDRNNKNVCVKSARFNGFLDGDKNQGIYLLFLSRVLMEMQ